MCCGMKLYSAKAHINMWSFSLQVYKIFFFIVTQKSRELSLRALLARIYSIIPSVGISNDVDNKRFITNTHLKQKSHLATGAYKFRKLISIYFSLYYIDNNNNCFMSSICTKQFILRLNLDLVKIGFGFISSYQVLPFAHHLLSCICQE